MSDKSSLDKLQQCMRLIYDGPWRFIQLRDDPFSEESINGDDIDLLGTWESVSELIAMAQEWVRAGLCHVYVSRRRFRKTELVLFSIDGRHYLRFDLWIHLPQIDDAQTSVAFTDLEKCLPELETQSAIRRLPVDVEACLFVHHLICKRKNPRDEKQQRRLGNYMASCGEIQLPKLVETLAKIQQSGKITDAESKSTLLHLYDQIGKPHSVVVEPIHQRVIQAVLAPPRKASWCSIVGCDGAGKTALAHEVMTNGRTVQRNYTGKHLYRKSLIYKLAVIFIRPLTFQSRENFDELIAPLAYLRACLGLRVKMLFSARGVTLMDRCLADFLYLDRKTDAPRFSRFAWLMNLFGRRIPVVHCLVSFENVQKRKDEMTQLGHKAYDDAMYQLYTTNCPGEYIAFNNDGTLKDSAASLIRLIDRFWGHKAGEDFS